MSWTENGLLEHLKKGDCTIDPRNDLTGLPTLQAFVAAPQDAQAGHRKARKEPWGNYVDLVRCRFPGPSKSPRWPDEEAFSTAVASWRRENMRRIPDLQLFHHLPNENSHRKAGVVGGFPDWHLPVAKGRYVGFWCELKVGKGTPSDTQIAVIRMLEDRGHYVVVVWDSLDAVIEEMEGYLDGVSGSKICTPNAKGE